MMESRIEKVLGYAAAFLFGFALCTFAVTLPGPVQAALAPAQPDRYRIRSELLMQATDEVGVCSPEDAARVWAEGLKRRSAALQYAVMTKALKFEYAMQLEQTFPNWVTGVSSPWVDSYEIAKVGQTDPDNWNYTLRFHLKTSTGPAGDYNADLHVTRDGEFWRIKKAVTDRGLDPYTGFLRQ